jgi:hypothetical protein
MIISEMRKPNVTATQTENPINCYDNGNKDAPIIIFFKYYHFSVEAFKMHQLPYIHFPRINLITFILILIFLLSVL